MEKLWNGLCGLNAFKKQKKNKLMGMKIAGIEIHSTCTDKIKNGSTKEDTWDYYNSKGESK